MQIYASSSNYVLFSFNSYLWKRFNFNKHFEKLDTLIKSLKKDYFIKTYRKLKLYIDGFIIRSFFC